MKAGKIIFILALMAPAVINSQSYNLQLIREAEVKITLNDAARPFIKENELLGIWEKIFLSNKILMRKDASKLITMQVSILPVKISGSENIRMYAISTLILETQYVSVNCDTIVKTYEVFNGNQNSLVATAEFEVRAEIFDITSKLAQTIAVRME